MAIFGINFNNFGSKRPIQKDDYNKNRSEGTELLIKYGIPDQNLFNYDKVIKYALPSDPSQYAEDLEDDAPTIKYGIPSDNFKPYFNINEKRPNNDGKIIKYGIPNK